MNQIGLLLQRLLVSYNTIVKNDASMNQIGLPIAVFTVYPMENKKKKIKVIIFSSLLSMNISLTII